MKTQFTLIKNDNHITKLPHNNKNNHNIFSGSNVYSMHEHTNYQFTLSNHHRASNLEQKFKLSNRSQKLKATHQELRTALESANIMAHNLKSPLMALGLLMGNKAISDSSKSIIRLALNKIKETASEIQLLDTAYSSSNAPSTTYNVEINSFIKECFNEVKFIYEQDKNISFNLKLTDKKIEAKICPKKFKDALYNIIKNSYESIEQRGSIEISVMSIHDKVEIRVADTGKGIPQHLVSYLGEKRVTYGKRGGTGIGLYHVKKVLCEANGNLRVKSIENFGTQASMVLPKANYYTSAE